ncbi:MAG: hypothetical protein PHS44_04830 [Candidatus Dojkabacteria bacterium]|nr:hypothetical protein [Candidatus Dojkabacteria bacterium]
MKKTSSGNLEKGTNNPSDDKQLGINLRYSKFEFIYKLKRLARKVEKNYTVLPFWQNGLIWTAIFSVFGVSSIIIMMLIKRYHQLPNEVPLIYDIENESWRSFQKILLYTIPGGLLILGILNIQVLRKTYYMNKRLTLMICLLLTVLSFLTLVATTEIMMLSLY